MDETSFCVTFHLSTPILMDRGINLAGLVAKRLADAGDTDPLAALPFSARGGVWAASDMFVVGQGVENHVAFVRSLRPTAIPDEIALVDKRGRTAPKFTLRDELKNLLDQRIATSTPLVAAFAHGDAERVGRILDGIESIGAKRSSGYGQVETVEISPITNPHAGFADLAGKPMRAVPIEVWRGFNLPPQPVRTLVARLPRWSQPPEPCVGPREWTMAADDYVTELGAP
jgi:CRISPR type IV-associated protein Csf3